MRFKFYAVCLSLSLSIAFSSCKSGGSDAESLKYVDSYSESVMCKSPIVVKLSEELPAVRVDVSAVDLAKAFSFSPSVGAFKVERIAERTVTITPAEPLKSSREYRMKIRLDRILGGKAEVRTIVLPFSTPELRVTVTDEIMAVQGETEREFAIFGTVSTTDYCDSSYIEKGIRLSGDAGLFKWSHSADGKTHDFSVSGIKSGDKARKVKLLVDYTSISKSSRGEDLFEVPAKGDFSIMNVSVVNEPLAIVLNFSDFIDADQNISDFIEFDPPFEFRTSVQQCKVRIFPESRKAGAYKLKVARNVASLYGKSLSADYEKDIEISGIEPYVKWLKQGSVLPSDSKSVMLFRSANYLKAEIRVKKVYGNNVMQFLQYDTWDANYYIDKVAKVIADTVMVLGTQDEIVTAGSGNYAVDISSLFKAERGCIYRLEICGRDPVRLEDGEDEDRYWSDMYFGDYSTYDDRHRDVIASDFGIIVKGGDSFRYQVYVTNLLTAEPVSGVHVKFFNSVQQEIGIALTDAKGKAEFQCPEEAKVVMAYIGNDVNYIKTDNGSALSTSSFDVGGVSAAKSVKACLFGDRGVWRPGDTLHVTAVTCFDGREIGRASCRERV